MCTMRADSGEAMEASEYATSTPPSWSWWRMSMPSSRALAPRSASETALGWSESLNVARFVTTAE